MGHAPPSIFTQGEMVHAEDFYIQPGKKYTGTAKGVGLHIHFSITEEVILIYYVESGGDERAERECIEMGFKYISNSYFLY